MDLKTATVVSGEASESDEDASNSSAFSPELVLPPVRIPNYRGIIISGEAPESDDDETSLSSVSGAVDAVACAPYAVTKIPKTKQCPVKYNSLLHKKLRDCNKTLNNDLVQLVEGTTNSAIQELSTVNREMLKSEFLLQEVACQLRNGTTRTEYAIRNLRQMTDANFLYSVKI